MLSHNHILLDDLGFYWPFCVKLVRPFLPFLGVVVGWPWLLLVVGALSFCSLVVAKLTEEQYKKIDHVGGGVCLVPVQGTTFLLRVRLLQVLSNLLVGECK